MKSLYRAINEQLTGIPETPPQGHALKRINTLTGLVTGMIRKGSSHLPDIGSGLCGDTYFNSKTVAAKRFVSNKWVDYETHYLPYLVAFIRGILVCTCPLGDGLVLVIDGSQAGKDNAVLMVSLVWRGRGIPICWITKQGGKGHFKAADHEALVSRVMEIITPLTGDCPVTLLGDGEFDGVGLQQLCLSHGWDYVLRTASDTVMFNADGERFQARDIAPHPSSDCILVPSVEFTLKRMRHVNFVCWHDSRHENPVFLVSNLPEAGDIIHLYDKRYSIECLFKDIKSTSFNLHKTRLKKSGEVNNLVLIASLAFLLLTVFAIRYDNEANRKKVQRIRGDRKVLSFFSFAIRLMHHFLDNGVNFTFLIPISQKNNILSSGSG